VICDLFERLGGARGKPMPMPMPMPIPRPSSTPPASCATAPARQAARATPRRLPRLPSTPSSTSRGLPTPTSPARRGGCDRPRASGVGLALTRSVCCALLAACHLLPPTSPGRQLHHRLAVRGTPRHPQGPARPHQFARAHHAPAAHQPGRRVLPDLLHGLVSSPGTESQKQAGCAHVRGLVWGWGCTCMAACDSAFCLTSLPNAHQQARHAAH
jgi:hypothetical protein